MRGAQRSQPSGVARSWGRHGRRGLRGRPRGQKCRPLPCERSECERGGRTQSQYFVRSLIPHSSGSLSNARVGPRNNDVLPPQVLLRRESVRLSRSFLSAELPELRVAKCEARRGEARRSIAKGSKAKRRVSVDVDVDLEVEVEAAGVWWRGEGKGELTVRRRAPQLGVVLSRPPPWQCVSRTEGGMACERCERCELAEEWRESR